MATTKVQYRLRFFAFIIKVIFFLLTPYFWLVSLKPHKRVPPITDKLLLISAVELADAIRNRKIKSENVVRAYIKRICDVNPILNAVCEDNFKAAIAESQAIDEFLAKTNKRPDHLANAQPLLGVPITIKESCSVKGLSYTGGGLVLRQGVKAEKDGDCVALLRQAGAIVLAVTNTPELCMTGETYNLVFGRTLNPYNTNRSAAGSSGGEAALLAAGASVIGLGSDLAGSVRIPAMFCGLFGHKPTAYATPFGGHLPYSDNSDFLDLAIIGPLTRYAKDMKLMMKVLTKNTENKFDFDEKVNVKKLNVFYKEVASNSLVITQVNNDIKQAMRSVVNYLDGLGVNVKPANFLDLQCMQEICCTYLSHLRDIPKTFQDIDNSLESKNLIMEDIKTLFGFSNYTFETILVLILMKMNFLIPRSQVPIYVNEAQKTRELLKRILGNNGVFLFPTFPIPAFQHLQSRFCSEGLFYSLIVNIWGFPATNVPVGLNKNGIPVGIQVIAGPNQDRLCLAVAEELEKKFGGWIPPTKVHTD